MPVKISNKSDGWQTIGARNVVRIVKPIVAVAKIDSLS